jgi:hypothetical protein
MACKHVVRQRPRKKQLYNSRYWITGSQTSMFTRQQLEAKIEELRFLSDTCRDINMSVSGVSGITEELGSEWVSERVAELLRFSSYELLLLEAGNWGTGTVKELRGRGRSIVGSRYQATVSRDCNRLRTLVSVSQRFVKCSHALYQKVQ